jgi:transcriptional regulator with XRE-family HTH domain
MPGRTKRRFHRSPIAVKLGHVVREARDERKLTQEQLAEHASLSKNAVGNIERGEFDVTVATLKRVADALGTDASDLLRTAGL